MISFALYGRTGQGVRTASRIIARSTFYSGFQVQCLIPYANSVQTGFIKVDKAPITSRDMPDPDFFLVFDAKIGADMKGAKEGASIIVNFNEKPKVKTKNKTKVFYIDAASIALPRKQMVNMPMVGALAKVFGKLPMKHIKTALDEEGLPHTFSAVEEGFRSVKK